MISIKSVNRRVYQVLVWILLAVGIFVLIRLSPTLTNPAYLNADDFFHFWVSGNQNFHGLNPFDPQTIERMRSQEGGIPIQTTISVTLNPPWVISVFMPFGLLDYSISRMIWLILTIGIIQLSAQVLWQVYSGGQNKRWFGILAVFIFSPTISALEKGQITIFALLGLTGFLYFIIIKRNDWLAGACLSLVSFKPQLVLLFWLALLIWVIQQRHWKILLGVIIAILFLTIVTILFNPLVLQQYFTMLHSYSISDWANPTIGSYLRFFWLGIDKFWLQYLPSLIGAVWFLYYWYHHYKLWDWANELPIILLASLITSPYAWTYDQVILIPAIIQATIWIVVDWKRYSTVIIAISYLALNLLNLLLHTKLDEFWFIWLAPTLLILYLITRWRYSTSLENSRVSLSSTE